MRSRLVLLLLISFLAGAKAKQPNIVLLSVDDMNCDSIGVFGCQVEGITPNIDALAAESLRFEHAHVHASSCVPSRNIILTGQYLWNSGVEGFYNLPPSVKKNYIIPEFFRDHGYFTMIRGKASHSTPYYPHPGWDIDFDGEKRIKDNIRKPQTFYTYTKEGVEEAKASGKPFFYSINLYDPHTALYNWNPKEGSVLGRSDKDNHPSRIYGPDEIRVPAFLPDTEKVRLEVAAYFNNVRRADDSIGQVVHALKESGVWEDTIIIFFSDHGMPFPFAKTANYYHSTRTPLLIRWPGITKPGRVESEQVVGVVDLFPTVAEMIDKEAPANLDGESLVPILKAEAKEIREFVYTMYEENVGGNRQPTRSVVSKDFGYLYNPWSDGIRVFATATRGMASTKEMERLASEGDSGMQKRLDLFKYRVPEEFYHYREDPHALHNLIDDPETKGLIKTFKEKMKEFMEVSNDPLLELFTEQHNESRVAAYLKRLDQETAVRKAKPEVFKRGYANKMKAEAKSNDETVTKDGVPGETLTPEEKARIEKRRKNRAAKRASSQEGSDQE